jgi:hypothetical protein
MNSPKKEKLVARFGRRGELRLLGKEKYKIIEIKKKKLIGRAGFNIMQK